MYKVCRRVHAVCGPIVAKDTYCLEVVGKELRGEGERNAQGEEEGRGTMVYADGDMYEGQWLAGGRHGHGKYTFATGNVYEGAYVEDLNHGHGKMTYAHGDVYEGEYVEDEKQGQGKYTNAAGSYDGEYANGKKHGTGMFTYADGEVEIGRWEADDRVGQGVCWSADRAEAWELKASGTARSISLDKAATIAKRIGLPVPPRGSRVHRP
eukprot:scaffold61753_cov57-Phaeocystis_antarctica.AAC.2